MFKKHKNLRFLLPALLVTTIFSLSQQDQEITAPPLAQLNYKYGLVGAEALSETKNLTAFQKDKSLKASIANALKPQKEVIVKLKNANSEGELSEIVFLKLKTLEQAETIAEEYTKIAAVEYAEVNEKIESIEDQPSDSSENNLGTDKLKASDSLSRTSPPWRTIEQLEHSPSGDIQTLVAVIDSGVDSDHPDLENYLVPGWDFVDGDEVPDDTVGHGTHIAGIISQNSGAKIMALKFTDDNKKGKLSNLLKAIKFAADNGVQIINLSLGMKNNSKSLAEAVEYATKKNVTIIAAAGNHGKHVTYYPAALENVIAVSALGKNGEKLFISNFDEKIDFSALGQDVYSSFPDNAYAYRTGTSQAAAIVSALAVKAFGTGEDVYTFLEKISEPIEGKYAGLLGRKLEM